MNREIKFRENWRWVAGFEGLYKISSKGRVKSVKRKGVTVDRILKHSLDSSGYPQVKMYKNRKGINLPIKFANSSQILKFVLLNIRPFQ